MRAALVEARKAMASDEVPIGAVIAVGGADRGGGIQSADLDGRSDRARRDSRPPRGGAGDRQLPVDRRDAVRDGRAVRDVRRRHGARAHRHVDIRSARAENRRRAFDA